MKEHSRGAKRGNGLDSPIASLAESKKVYFSHPKLNLDNPNK